MFLDPVFVIPLPELERALFGARLFITVSSDERFFTDGTHSFESHILRLLLSFPVVDKLRA